MKKAITSILLVATVVSYAQKTEKTSVDIETELTPRNLISKTRKVDIEVSSNYTALVDERNAELFKLKDEQAKKGLGRKVFEKSLTYTVFDPKNPTAESIFVPTLIGEEFTSQFKVPGYTEDNSSNGKIKIIFSALRIFNQTDKEFSYVPLLADVVITNDKGVNIYTGIIGDIKGSLTYKIAIGEKLQGSYINAEKAARLETIAMINKMLTDNFGFLKMKGERSFFDIKDKKIQYPEMHTALEKVTAGLTYIKIESKKTEAENLIKEAIAIWEDAVKSLDKQNKDAKINKNNGAAIYLNIAEASIWMHDFDKSRVALAEYKLLDEDYSRAFNKTEIFLEDYSKRYESWVSYE